MLLVVGAVLTAAATLGLAAPDVGARVIHTVRTGLCIVGGDLCRSSDAAAAGLPPCVTKARSKRQDTTLDLAVVRLGGHGEWQIALQSDGGALVTRLEENELGGTVGVGLTFSPVGINAGAGAAVVAGYRSGRAWRFADAAAAAAFLDGAMRDAAVHEGRAPDIRWRALGGSVDGSAGISISELAGVGLSGSAAGAVGLRTEGPRKTLTLDAGIDELTLEGHLPGFPAAPDGKRAVVAELTWESGAVRELALRGAVARDERLEEHIVRLDLREPESRAVAERLLRPGADRSEALRALARHAARHGVVERHGYTTSERRRGVSVGARLGASLAIAHQRITAERRLVDAVAWVRGGPLQRRLDCLGV